MQVNLAPLAKSQDDILSYLDTNFRRLADALELLANIDTGINTVTGTLVITTGLALVQNVLVTLNGDPVAGACLVRAKPVGTSAPKDIEIKVFDNVFALSTVAKDVAWYAIGK